MTYDIPAQPPQDNAHVSPGCERFDDPNYIGCLDHGFVRLLDHMGNDLSVVRAARNSHDAAWRAGVDEANDERLIHYLMRNRHSTPFEVVEFQFEVKAPIFIFRQWHRHRTATINEVSGRYTVLPDEYYTPLAEQIGTQSKANKQGRDIGEPDDMPLIRRENEIRWYKRHCEEGFNLYHDLLEQGWPKELARMHLPLSTYSKMFWKQDLWNLMHFLSLRLDGHAQYEIRVFAQAILKLIEPIVPVSIGAWSIEKGIG